MNLPRKLQKGESFGSLYTLWNELVDYLRSTQLKAAPGLRLRQYASGTVIESAARNTSAAATAATAVSAPPAYNSYFTLKLIAERAAQGNATTYTVRIVDGATYDAETGNCGNCLACVNGQYKAVAKFEQEVTETAYFYLEFTPPLNVANSVIVKSGTTYPSDTTTNSYFPLGRAIKNGDAWMISQEHTAGVAMMYWQAPC